MKDTTAKSVQIDRKQCIECGLCVEQNGDIFYIKNHKSTFVDNLNISDPKIQSKIEESLNMCPVGAIKINY